MASGPERDDPLSTELERFTRMRPSSHPLLKIVGAPERDRKTTSPSRLPLPTSYRRSVNSLEVSADSLAKAYDNPRCNPFNRVGFPAYPTLSARHYNRGHSIKTRSALMIATTLYTTENEFESHHCKDHQQVAAYAHPIHTWTLCHSYLNSLLPDEQTLREPIDTPLPTLSHLNIRRSFASPSCSTSF
ncbi:hypothetical protein P167DRAFT_580156 [Morchella conica CCBAS932]|uniref:Uncharacterized protein n=1 Tax=Morchella conica CCBAS932 TaxID=1392247 RepID=A0A3N4KBK3_9PEZI|nr:hypothetical protein P167DRAFT_580156 [Morchella conica CCBAS932]